MRKPCILVVCRDSKMLKLIATWVRSHGCDVCACLAEKFPAERVWPDRFVGAVLDDRAIASPAIDALYLCDGWNAALAKSVLEAWVRRGGEGCGVIQIRPGVSRPVWGTLRAVRGCGYELAREEAVLDEYRESWRPHVGAASA